MPSALAGTVTVARSRAWRLANQPTWRASAFARFMNGVSPVSWASDEELAVVVQYAEDTSSYAGPLVERCLEEIRSRVVAREQDQV